MDREFYAGNRRRLYGMLEPGSLLVLFSGTEVRKTNDEFFPFFAHRSFVYLTGLEGKELALIARKDGAGRVAEKLYLLPPDPMAERWTGRRVKADEAAEISGVSDLGYVSSFESDLHALASGGYYGRLYLDLYRAAPSDRDAPSHRLLRRVRSDYPFLRVENADALIRRLRLTKQPCEIEAMRRAEEITAAGITAMMRASRPGMYEYHTGPSGTTPWASTGPRGRRSPPSSPPGGTTSASTTTPAPGRPWTGTWCSTTWAPGTSG